MKSPPNRSRGILSDVRLFFLHRPEIPTLIKFADKKERENYTRSILQRIGIDVARYSVLNIHRIGIRVPVRYAFEELLQWDGDSTCWPNHIASVDRVKGELEHIRIFLFGKRTYPFGLKREFFGFKFIPLFCLNVIRFQRMPGLSDDNARYLLYESSGGYPIGVFTMYVRSPIAERGEAEPSQLFLAVGFNFYGKDTLSKTGIVNRTWEHIHNRVTANVLNRFKQLCEWRFQRIQDGK